MTSCVCNPSNRSTKEEKCSRVAGQCNQWALGSVRDCLRKQGGEQVKEDMSTPRLYINPYMGAHAPPHPREHMYKYVYAQRKKYFYSGKLKHTTEDQSLEKQIFHWHHHESTSRYINMLPQVSDADIYGCIISCLNLSTHQIEALRLSGRQLIK